MSFEWDEKKRESNLRKHGIDFVRAARVFENPTIEVIDDREAYGEDRIIAIGHAEWFFLVVVYVWRGDNRRIISARKAGAIEREEYYTRVFGPAGEDEGPDES